MSGRRGGWARALGKPLLLAAGYTPGLAAALTGLLGLAALPGRVLFVPLLSRLGALPLTLLLFAGLGLGALLLHFPASLALAGVGGGLGHVLLPLGALRCSGGARAVVDETALTLGSIAVRSCPR